MKIGIYLGYAPYIKPMSLKQEGLGRYLAFLVKGFSETGNTITIACPNWVNPLLEELFDEVDIDVANIELLNPSADSALLKMYYKWANRKPKQKIKRNRIKRVMLSWTDLFVDILVHSKNIAVLLLIFILCVVIGIVLLPFILVAGIVGVLLGIIRKLLAKLLGVEATYLDLKRIIKKIPYLKDVFVSLRKRYSGSVIQEKIRRYSTDEIVRKANHMKESPEVWYSPSAFWGEFNELQGVRVICAPDIVTAEFPSKFSQGPFVETTKQVSDTIEKGNYFITYCNYLKESLLVDKFFKAKDDVAVIAHAQNDMYPFLNLEDYFKRIPFKENVSLYFAKNIVLPGILTKSVNMENYLVENDNTNNFSFRDVEYLFYPSQIRGNKNILNLIKAYEYILRNKNIPIKLVLTCNLNHDKEVKDYIYDKCLQYDVLSFSSVTAQQLAALYMCATLVVNPTLYEGGFPFTFGEGMSVGTPSVMSNISQVKEVMAGYDLEEFMFNPYDYLDIAKKIERGLQNREILLSKEEVIYNQLKKRTWKDVSEEYIHAFQYFIDRSNTHNEVS